VCAALQLNCGSQDPITEVVVLKIVELAKAGETGPERLCAGVLAGLETRDGGSLSSELAARARSVPLPH